MTCCDVYREPLWMDELVGHSVLMKIMLVLTLHEIEVCSPCNQEMYAKRNQRVTGIQVGVGGE